jgi:eukaryotic-like serine/threonine-protein kinase
MCGFEDVRGSTRLPAGKRRASRILGCVGVAATSSLLLLPSASGAPPRPRVDRVLVPAGTFVQGATGADDETPVRNTHLPAFRIDRTEVTRGMYGVCVAAGRCAPAKQPVTTELDLPMTDVTWHEAAAFCAFAGGRLPTEAEWEKAARGTDGRVYPWGADLTCERANWGNYENEGPCAGKNPGRPVRVGAYQEGASPYGVLDLGGNVWEWVADAYDREPGRRVVRGGSCCSYFVEPRAANRNAWDPAHRDGDLGFRCVAR